ncbi:TlyA family RNA methyltransferase [Pandoraea pnomenusa]|uniref:TlyA family RNA methyltransferase n=1 Tax=Pandoraea pnomenusa TaxID=93220 RepID=UPI0011989CCD|nr:TlyA family RNA methyltransferase [Pandoraea pnomenusa]QDX19933.1 TlyA family RNA methyltransferase [Pandoraea pnomenusa]
MSQALRADQALVCRGLAASRTAAQRLIDAGRVYYAGTETALKKASQVVADDEHIEVRAAPDGLPDEDRYVSRGGLKLAGALAQTGLGVGGRVALDVGLSTGGFADCLLQAGVARVVGVDVGHGQLHPRLASEPRLVSLEGINARHLSRELLDARLATASAPDAIPEAGFDLIVGDVSFISLTLVLPALAPLLAPAGDLLMLVKPQFEVGREHVGRGGLVKDAAQYAQVETKIRTACESLGLTVAAWLDSPIAGGDGNREFFVHARRA